MARFRRADSSLMRPVTCMERPLKAEKLERVRYSSCCRRRGRPNGNSKCFITFVAGMAVLYSPGSPILGPIAVAFHTMAFPLFMEQRSWEARRSLSRNGTVYELAPHNGKWYYKTLYSFCPQQHCPDGSYPSADLVVDAAGNLYGTASGAGLPSNGGTVFELSPTGNGWRETTLYSFCPQTGCPDGMFPSGSLTLDSSGDLLGVADGGGTAESCPPGDIDGCGVIFRIKLNGANSSETVLYDFCQHQNCADGSFPNIGLTFGSPGKFFGVTALGGGKGADPNGGGTVFQLSYRTEKVLHSFCAEDNCADGQDPHARLIIDGSGNLFGITATGGNSTNSGTVFEITP